MSDSGHYRLGKGVSLHSAEGSLILASNRPLQVVKIHPAWKPILSRLRRDKPVWFHSAKHRPQHVTEEQAGFFFKELCAKGFLEQDPAPEDPFFPTISLIIPVRNRPADLKQCLDSLADLHYPSHLLEIIVVDDASTDHTPAVAKKYPGIRLYTHKEWHGASFCRNFGALLATGDILCFLDSDCRATGGWLNGLTPAFLDSRVSAAGGMVASDLDRRALDRYEQVQSSLYMGMHPKDSRNEDRFFYLPSCNFAVRREWFLRIGGFGETLALGEDVDFCWRLVDSGGNIVYRPGAKVYHRHRNRIADFCSRRFDYGTSEPMLQSLHRTRRKTLPLCIAASGFWILVLASCLLHPLFAGAAVALTLADTGRFRKKLAGAGFHPSLRALLMARCRHYAGVMYAATAFFSRYHLYFLPILIATGQIGIAIALSGGHLSVAAIQYMKKKPKLNFFSFAFFFTLEQVSYQAGVWYGCLRYRLYTPVLPHIRILF